ncbi:MAG: hypothetical protein WC319_04120 [Candidatus Paceibacterota bacterium]|jgi:hypothetical protein
MAKVKNNEPYRNKEVLFKGTRFEDSEEQKIVVPRFLVEHKIYQEQAAEASMAVEELLRRFSGPQAR